jgi:hypothetical protein
MVLIQHAVALYYQKEREEFEKIHNTLIQQHQEEISIAQLPQAQDWIRQRSALDFAKNKIYSCS